MNNFTILLCCIWICGTIYSIACKDSDGLGIAFITTVIIGFGYLLSRGH